MLQPKANFSMNVYHAPSKSENADAMHIAERGRTGSIKNLFARMVDFLKGSETPKATAEMNRLIAFRVEFVRWKKRLTKFRQLEQSVYERNRSTSDLQHCHSQLEARITELYKLNEKIAPLSKSKVLPEKNDAQSLHSEVMAYVDVLNFELATTRQSCVLTQEDRMETIDTLSGVHSPRPSLA